jgi:hypothetical protein
MHMKNVKLSFDEMSDWFQENNSLNILKELPMFNC